MSAPDKVDLVVQLADRVEELERALREADRLASVAHDAIWDMSVAPTQILHDNDYETSAQRAIWQLHETIRPLLGETSNQETRPDGEA